MTLLYSSPTFSPWGLWIVDAAQDPVYAGGHILVEPDAIETWGFDAVVSERRYAWVTPQGDPHHLSAESTWGDEVFLHFVETPEGTVLLTLSGMDVLPWAAEFAVLRASPGAGEGAG